MKDIISAINTFESGRGDVPDYETNRRILKILVSLQEKGLDKIYHPVIEAFLCRLYENAAWYSQQYTKIAARQIISKFQIHAKSPVTEVFLDRISREKLFLLILKKELVANPELEPVLWRARIVLSKRVLENPDLPVNLKQLVAAMCQQCFTNEYVYPYSDEDKQRVEKLAALLEPALEKSSQDIWEMLLLTLGMWQRFESLGVYSAISELPEQTFSRYAQPVIRKMLVEPAREKEIKQTLHPFSPIKDKVSRKVMTQYEQYPYPRWRTPDPPPYRIAETIRHHNQDFCWPADFEKEEIQVLVPGCGTGKHPVGLALANPKTRILAMDLSTTSLSYAVRMANAYQLNNIEFLQGDILDLPKLKKTFHHIDCVGVLHHMARAHEGWQCLTDVLKPGGTLYLGLYSCVARAPLEQLKIAAEKENISPLPDGMRNFRKSLFDRGHGAWPHIRRSGIDLYSLSMFKDLLFHAHERCYHISEIARLIDRFNYRFIAFNPGRLRKVIESLSGSCFPSKDFSFWEKQEKLFTGTMRMLLFWLQKKEK